MLAPTEAERIRAAATSPEAAERLTAFLGSHTPPGNSPSTFELLAEAVDESDHGLDEWLESLDHLIQWAERRLRPLSVPGALGYVACCSESQGTQPFRLALPEVLDEMLEEFGYEGESAANPRT
ncbi:MAG: hypothetical protein ACFB21_11640 [Opitutales bacterium]